MSCSCVEGKYPINIIQGDSYHNAYTFYDKDGEVITAEHIGAVYWNCARLEYQQQLEYNVEDSSWIFYLSSTETADFAYCKTTYDLTLYFTDEQVETEIYSSELRILEKKNKPSAGSYSGGEPFDANGITTNIYTGLIVTAGGGGETPTPTEIITFSPNTEIGTAGEQNTGVVATMAYIYGVIANKTYDYATVTSNSGTAYRLGLVSATLPYIEASQVTFAQLKEFSGLRYKDGIVENVSNASSAQSLKMSPSYVYTVKLYSLS